MLVIALVCILTAIPVGARTQPLNQDAFGIAPLQSTRADVERLYGVSNDPCRCVFRTTTETLEVAFSTSPCAGAIYGWNVPKDTVLSFKVTPHVAPWLSEIKLDLTGFVTRYSPEDRTTTYRTNVEKGILFTVQDSRVISVTRYPPSSENRKRCEGFPAWDGVPPPTPFATIITGIDADLHPVLDNLAFELSTNTRTRGYIVAYAGKKSRRGEGKEMADKARQYLVERRTIEANRVIAIDGGFRETAQYDLFSLNPETPPPTPTPTVPSNKVQIIGSTMRTKRQRPRLQVFCRPANQGA